MSLYLTWVEAFFYEKDANYFLVSTWRNGALAERPTKKLVIVAGMHRSGTSAFTGAIELLGVQLGRQLAQGHEGINEKGYKEDMEVIDLHEDILWSQGSAWNNVFPDEPDVLDADKTAQAKIRIRDILEKYFKVHSLCGVKDPRVCLFLPLWLEACQDLNIDVSILVPFRSPAAVARSLNKRDGLSVEFSEALWVKYLICAEKYSRGHRRMFASYESLLKEPKAVLARVAQALELFHGEENDTKLDAGVSFISSSLNRHGGPIGSEYCSGDLVERLYSMLQRSEDGNAVEEEIFDAIDQDYRSQFLEMNELAVEQVKVFREHAAAHRIYWKQALNSRSNRIGRFLKKILLRRSVS